ncbi:MAG: carboxypeptidase regulatory-like domain-containing protein [Deltaproteobacteria bacterium]|nr:carboxypeptidase regulatory-like domain-containing protein [Deltaproteobacteria bacterium]
MTDAVTGQVNLAGGVSGDTNKMASWDVFGIGCTRCHGSVIDNTTNGGVPPFTAPTGQSSHHNNLTTFDSNSGVCTDNRFTLEAQCEGNGGSWLTSCSIDNTTDICTQAITTEASCIAPGVWVAAPGWCSNAFYSDQTACTTNGFSWQAGWCTRPDKDSGTCSGGSGTSALSWRRNGSQASCQVASGVWSFSKCSVEGVCNVDNTITSKAACDTAGGQFAYATDVIRCIDIEHANPSANVEWTGNNTYRGQMITSLCMNCHRQETQGQPYANTGNGVGSGSGSNPGSYVKVGQYHSTLTFPSHPHGNMFLNSPHAKFTGTFNEIGTTKLGTGYDSYFLGEGEAAGTGNGCTGCHNPHRSTVKAVGGEEATEPRQACHTGPYAVDLSKINHLHGAGTPFDPATVGEGEAEPCITCHMPGGQHMFRINPSASYSTFPASILSSATVTNANTAADGSFSSAVWVDVDAACGQCHGGGSNKASTTLTLANSTDATLGKTLTVASTTGFAVGQRIEVAGAGSYTYDEAGSVAAGDFDSYITGVTSGTTLTVVGAAPFSVSPGAVVKQNPTQHGAPYYTKAQLALVAKGMHKSSGVVYAVTFSTSVSGSGLQVAVDASVDCGSNPCPVFTYDWDWGDSTAHGSADPDSHTYATAGTKSIKLTVNLAGKVAGSATRSVNLVALDQAPVAAATCTWDADLWKMSVLDASTDDNAVTQVVVDFGDGSSKTIAPAGSSINRTYTRPGTFTVTDRAIDAKLQSSTYTCPTQATPAYFTISGTVKNKTGATNLSSATVQLYSGASIVKSVRTAANGTFTIGSLKPGNYTLKVVKSGYTFANPAATISVGPSSAGNTINATNK